MSSQPGESKSLKFRDPGQRDTVVKVQSKSNSEQDPQAKKPQQAERVDHYEKKENPLLAKIRETLKQSDPAKWEHYGAPLNTKVKYPKAYEAWEMVYCIDLPTGLLVFRSSQPVVSEYFGGGYTVNPKAPSAFSIELRSRAWDPRTLLDPYFRSVLEKDKNFKMLANGEVARELYVEIGQILSSFSNEQLHSLSNEIENLAANLLDKALETSAADWIKAEPDPYTVTYQGQLVGVTVYILKCDKEGLVHYRLTLAKDKITRKITDNNLAISLFDMLDEKNKHAALEALNDVLEKSGL